MDSPSLDTVKIHGAAPLGETGLLPRKAGADDPGGPPQPGIPGFRDPLLTA